MNLLSLKNIADSANLSPEHDKWFSVEDLMEIDFHRQDANFIASTNPRIVLALIEVARTAAPIADRFDDNSEAWGTAIADFVRAVKKLEAL